MSDEKQIDIIKTAQDAYKSDQSHWEENFRKARDDLFFMSDDKYAQWENNDYQSREETGRPAITIDQLGQFVHQVVNDIKMNTPAINILPGDHAADMETADIFKGLIKNIEYASNADDAYDLAATFAVKCGFGAIRVDHDYCDDESTDQELLIKRVVNPLNIFIDRESIEADGRDMKRCTILERMTVREFKKRWPKAEVSSFDEADKVSVESKEDEELVVAEFFRINETEKEYGYSEDGSREEVNEDAEKMYRTKRKIKQRKVERFHLSGKAVLEETTFPGKYIPIVPVYGEEAWRDGERHLLSLIRPAKSAQRMFNFMKSNEIETLMKQPIAPVMVGEGQIEEYKDDWINPSKSMALRYKTHDAEGNALPAPIRLMPPTIASGFAEMSANSVDLIKSSLGMYNASIGQKSNETSGVAINARQHEGDVANFHFSDNLVKSITQVGRICVYAIPEIYDTARIIRIIGEEGDPKQIGINGKMAPDQKRPFDLSQGKYDVKVVTGASFTTKRQEAAEFFTNIVTRQPELMTIMGDLLFENSDFAGAQAMANRMKKIIDPKLLEGEDGQDKNAPPAPDPEKQQMAQVIQELQAQLQQVGKQLQDKQAETQVKAADVQAKSQYDMTKLAVEAEDKEQTNALKAYELQLKAREVEIKEQQVAADIALQAQGQKIDVLMEIMARIEAQLPKPNEIGSANTSDMSSA